MGMNHKKCENKLLEIHFFYGKRISMCYQNNNKAHRQPVWVLWQKNYFYVNYQHISQRIPNNVLTKKNYNIDLDY